MKNRMSNKIWGWIAAAGLLVATSCVEDSLFGPESTGDEVTVSLTLAPENISTKTRSVEYPNPEGPKKYPKISDGSKADVLIYAVYDENGNLLDQHGRGVIGNLPGFQAGTGQTVMKIDTFPVTVNFRLIRGQKYKLAFWAQSSQCKAYNTQNLKKVEVIYSELSNESTETNTTTPNNDELRDAFCKVEDITAEEAVTKNIYLYRPLAQINVGTAGYDYEIVTRGENSKKYIYSKIQLGSVARYLDVVNDEVLKSTTEDDTTESLPEVLSEVDFGWAKIPAYVNVSTDDPSHTVEGEEFLEVDLDQNEEILPYADLDEKDGEKTETFKYLSMCYVLVPSDKNGGSATLDNVRVWLGTSEEGADEAAVVELTQVPVRRNWRTNIISQNLLTAEQRLTIDISPFYSGEFNTEDQTTWSGALYDGVSYNVETDEILISNANGLMWLAKMVNGKYSYYIWDEDNSLPDSNIADPEISKMANAGYYNKIFADNGIEDPTSGAAGYERLSENEKELLKKRILKATHEESWPANNNFHFKGATVRLTNDIDMSVFNEWIPIGFDCRFNDGKNSSKFSTDIPYHVGFCGTFNGNDLTISNLKNREFSSVVHYAYKDITGNNTVSNNERYDNPQWYPVGLFGQVGGDAIIKNVRLRNIDFKGHHGGGAIVGFASGNVSISNCYVDG
ncbi:MAG: hypothetical protein J1E02_08410, partial [Coprobacter sp.]|nr:hypothetical protein [Coprobacter sp.]